MKKLIKNFVLVLAIVFGVAGLAFASINNTSKIAYADADTHNHENMTAWESATSLPTSGSYYLTSDVRISTTCTVSGTLNLCLNGYGIRFTGTTIGSGSVFNLQAGKTLNLYDCGDTEHKYRIQPADIGTGFSSYVSESPAGLAKVDDTLTEDYQTFTGGYITGGIGMTNNNTYYNGGAVYILGGTFNMYGGTFIGNTVKNPSSSGNNGGAVYVVGGNFTMYDGAFIGNTVDISNGKSFNCGGAIYASAERVNGTIQGANVKIHGGIFKQNYAVSGGAFFVGSSLGGKTTSFEVNNATITENVAYVYQYSASGYGGVMYAQGGNVTFRNCEISENISTSRPFLNFSATVYSSDKSTYNLTIDNCNVTNNISQNDSTIQISGDVYDANVQCLVANISNTHIDNNKSISYGSAVNISGYSRVSSVKSVQLTMTNSTIKNNVINASSCAGMKISGKTDSGYYNGPEVTLTDCEISGNIAKYSGEPNVIAGVGFSYGMSSKLNISGKVVIANNKFHNTRDDVYKESNLYLSDTKNTIRINVIDELSEDSLIGVVKYIDPYYTNPKTNFGTGVFTTGLNSKGSIDNFFSDKENFYIAEENGEAVLKEKVSITYNKNTAKTGTVPPVAYYIPNETATIADNVGELAKSGHRFVGWNTLADGTGTMYEVGDTFEISENITLYAIFEHTSHNDIDFVLWSDELAEEQNGSGKTATNSLPSVAGDYYFVSNITISSIWTAPTGTTNICINGCTITTTASSAVYVPSNATLNIYDEDENNGKITGGKGGYDSKRGGGMYVEGSVTMYGGSITDNEAAYGGGVYIKNGSFTMYNNARVTSNKSKTSYDTWANGGGFLIDNGTLTIYGGYISSNTADREDAAIALAGGNLYLYGGSITYNTSGLSGSGSVRNYGSGDIYISGNPYVMNNNTTANSVTTRNDIYLVNGKKLIVDGELNQSAKIGVTLQNAGVFTQGLLGNGTASNFYSDNTSYGIVEEENGEVELYPSNAVAVISRSDGHTYYTTVADALNNWTDGTTFKLLADISGTQITVSSGTKTLDLNNHVVTYTSGSVIIVSGGTLNIKDDSTSKTKHYYNINTTGVASISTSTTNNYFEGGYITGGVATSDRGGGLRIIGGEVNFAGGTIFACRAGWGGGIWTGISASSLTISNDAAIIGCYSSGNYTSGGGIFCEGSCEITMTGGSIRHNSSQFSGGGVRVCLQESTGKYFTMTGGEITQNYSGSHQGSGLALDMADRIKIGGSAKIYDNDGDNLFLKNGGYVTVVEAFTQDALIVVKTQTLPTQSTPIVITDGWLDVMGDADYKNVFKWNNEEYRIRKNSSGELVASVLHVHNWTYSAQNDVITATCVVEEDDECTLESQTLTLVVLGKTFDGTAVVETTSKSEGWTIENGLAQPGEILYSGNINAGTYIASITIGEATATKEFTITPLKTVVVTITGHSSTNDYTGSAHTTTGFEAQSNSMLYDVANDFAFNGLAKAERTNAGTTYMQLSAEMFENTNSNFDDVTFVIVDGYQTVLTVDAVILTLPSARDIVANGMEQELIVQGIVDGGTLHYSVVMDMNEVPDAESYDAELPTAVNEGFYYIWYKVVADENHNDLEPAKLKMVFAGADWVVLNGVLYQNDETTEIANVKVSLKKGNQTIDFDFTNDNGEYLFKAPKGVYNLVAEHATNVETLLVEAFENKQQDIVISGTKTESKLEVNTEDDNYSGISVGGLNTEAYAIRQNDGIDDSISVSVLMTIEPKAKDDIANAEDIALKAKNKSLEFLDIKVKKTIDTVTTTLSETINILEIVVPYEKINRHDLIVYSYHDQAVRTFAEIQFGDEIVDGTFRLDKENGYIFIYTNCFSTFAIGYTPHYKVDTTISLGSFEGTANLTLVSQDDGTVYTLTDVDTTKVSFDDIPMGDYILTISWEDGVVNTLTMPIRISGKDSTTTTANAQSNATNNLGVTSQKQEVELMEVTNESFAVVYTANNYQNYDNTIESEIVIDTNNSFENVEVESVKVLESKPKAQTANQQTELVDMLNKQIKNYLEQEKYIVSNQNNKAIFKFENVVISKIGTAEIIGNPVMFGDDYIIKKTKENYKNV